MTCSDTIPGRNIANFLRLLRGRVSPKCMSVAPRSVWSFHALALLAPLAAQAQTPAAPAGPPPGAVVVGGAAEPVPPVAPAAPPPAAQQPSAAPPASAGALPPGAVVVGAPAETAPVAVAAETAATPAAPSVPEAPEEVASKALRLLGDGSSEFGLLGLLHTLHASESAVGQFRIQLLGEYMDARFLCTPAYPCPNPVTRNGPNVIGDGVTHSGGAVSVGATLLPGLELAGSVRAYTNTDGASRPSVLSAVGDLSLSAKYSYQFSPAFGAGLAVDGFAYAASGSVGANGDAISARATLIGTYDFRRGAGELPLRVSLNAGYFLDNSSALVADVEAARKEPISRVERFGLTINRADRIQARLGAEVFLASDAVRPFAEFGVDSPTNRQDTICETRNINNEGCQAIEAVTPMRATLGVRALPWKRGLSLIAAADLSIAGHDVFVHELAPQAPWMAYFGASWATDTVDRSAPPPPPVAPVIVVRPRALGRVTDKQSKAPVANAAVRWSNKADLTAMLSDAKGLFRTPELDVGRYTFDVSAEGFKPGTCEVTLESSKSEMELGCELESLPKLGNLKLRVVDETGVVVAGASVHLVDASGKATDGLKPQYDALPLGEAKLSGSAEGYLPAETTAVVRSGESVEAVLKLVKKQNLVTVGKKEITIKQQVQFALNSAQILPASEGLLGEIADAMRTHAEILKLEVQGHTDNQGGSKRNLTLSDARADSVRAWLASHGVGSDRVVAKGYGDMRPLAPNVTAGGRAKNRRVQFVILERQK